jgi:hypothetical protein
MVICGLEVVAQAPMVPFGSVAAWISSIAGQQRDGDFDRDGVDVESGNRIRG